MEVDGFSCAGRLAGGIEDLHDDNVGVESGEIAAGDKLAADDGGEVMEGSVLRRGKRRGGEWILRAKIR